MLINWAKSKLLLQLLFLLMSFLFCETSFSAEKETIYVYDDEGVSNSSLKNAIMEEDTWQ